MPSYIVKCDPDQDFYVMWSDIVDAPNVWGERAEVEGCRWLEPREVAAERFHRADEYGTSAQWKADQPGTTIVRPYAWDADGFVYEQQGFLPRAQLRELCERLEKGPADVTDLLEPIEEDAAPTGTRERLATSSDVPDPVLTGGLDTSLEPIEVSDETTSGAIFRHLDRRAQPSYAVGGDVSLDLLGVSSAPPKRSYRRPKRG